MQDISDHRHLRLISGVLISILVPVTGIFSYVSANEGALARPALVKIAQEAPPPPPDAPQPPPPPPIDAQQPFQENQPPADQNQGQPGQFNQGGNGQNMGPDSNFDEMQKKNDEMQKKQQAKQFAQTKRGMTQTGKQLAKIKASFAKVTAKGIAIPAECTDALTTAQATVDSVLAAADFEAVGEIDFSDLNDAMQTINDCQPKVQMLARMPQMLKQVDSQIKKIERTWTTAKKGAPVDAADAIADGDAAIAAIHDGRAKIGDLVKQGNIEDLGDALDENVFSKFDDVSAIINRIMAAKNAKRFIAGIPALFKNADKAIAKLKKAGEDTSEAEAALAKAKELYAAVKGLKPGSEEYSSAVDDLAQAGQDFAEASGTTDGQSLMGAPSQSMGVMPNLQMPTVQGMNFGGNNGGNNMGGPGPNMGGPGMAQ